MSVMGTKLSTKAFSSAPQNEIQHSDSTRSLSVTDQSKLNGEDMGEMLNKISDPNWVDPRKKVRAVGSDKLDKDAFMKLMLAQMKHQDPTNPLKSHEMAAQLAQFTSVEQLNNINSALQDIRNSQKPVESFQALNFIGKAVSGDSAKITRNKGDTLHEFSFNLPDDAQKVSIDIRNAEGATVKKLDLANLKKGDNNWNWNGQDERGTVLPTGEYRFLIEASRSDGKKLAVKTDFSGTITGVNYTAEGPVLLVGNQSIKLKDVKKISDPSLMKNDQILKNPSAQDLKAAPTVTQNDIKGADEQPFTASNLENVKMAQGMVNRLEKETKTDDPSAKPANPLGKTTPAANK